MPVRALSLLPGGLDSQLAVLVLQTQGIEVQAIVFRSVFFSSAPAEASVRRLNVPGPVIPFVKSAPA